MFGLSRRKGSVLWQVAEALNAFVGRLNFRPGVSGSNGREIAKEMSSRFRFRVSICCWRQLFRCALDERQVSRTHVRAPNHRRQGASPS